MGRDIGRIDAHREDLRTSGMAGGGDGETIAAPSTLAGEIAFTAAIELAAVNHPPGGIEIEVHPLRLPAETEALEQLLGYRLELSPLGRIERVPETVDRGWIGKMLHAEPLGRERIGAQLVVDVLDPVTAHCQRADPGLQFL